MRLTDLQIKKLKPPTHGQKTYFDEVLPGFGVRVSQGGSKSFVVMYGSRRQLKTLGRYPNLSLSDARRKAKRVQGDVSLVQNNIHSIPAINFTEARDRFLIDTERRNKSSTAGEYRRLLERHFTFTKKLHEISRQDIMRVIEKKGKSPSEAQHAYVAIRTMMNWCVKQGITEFSPVPTLSFKTEPRSRILSNEELKIVWNRAAQVGCPYGHIVQLLILTGQRRGEIAHLRWNWIRDNQLIFPQGFTKNKREHRIPIGRLTRELLDKIPNDTELVFPARGRTDTAISGWSKFKLAFDNPKGSEEPIVSDYTLHDLRRTYSSKMAELGTPIHVTEKLLNHVSGAISGVAAVYNRYSYMDEMREAVANYEAYIAQLNIQEPDTI